MLRRVRRKGAGRHLPDGSTAARAWPWDRGIRKNPSAGTTQRRFSNASRNDGSLSTVSAFALMHIEARLASFAQLFTKPQVAWIASRFPYLVLRTKVGLRRSDIEPWCVIAEFVFGYAEHGRQLGPVAPRHRESTAHITCPSRATRAIDSSRSSLA